MGLFCVLGAFIEKASPSHSSATSCGCGRVTVPQARVGRGQIAAQHERKPKIRPGKCINDEGTQTCSRDSVKLNPDLR
jgi:hypothetical protein